MEEKLEFLRRYLMSANADLTIISPGDVADLPEDIISELWMQIFSQADAATRVRMMLDIWREYASENLAMTIDFLEKNLDDIELLKINTEYSALYTVKSFAGQIFYYQGGSTLIEESITLESWGDFPQSIRDFYENIHNGFYYYPSKAMGLVSFHHIENMDEEEWGIVEDLDEPLQINMATSYGIFQNGAGGYVVIDTENCQNDESTLWFSDDMPRYKINFWEEVDEWIVAGMEN